MKHGVVLTKTCVACLAASNESGCYCAHVNYMMRALDSTKLTAFLFYRLLSALFEYSSLRVLDDEGGNTGSVP